MAEDFAKCSSLIILCGHYEGFDERICTLATHEISLGDYVLTGGELAALTIIDAVGQIDSWCAGKIDVARRGIVQRRVARAPAIHKPQEFRGMSVPDILRSGNHKAVSSWRRAESLKRTLLRRPDLLAMVELSAEDKRLLNDIGS